MSIVSSRTPDGVPKRCPICGRELLFEPSPVSQDATCPHCGALITDSDISYRADDRSSAADVRIDDLRAATVDMALTEIVDLLQRHLPIEPHVARSLCGSLVSREQLGSSDLGNGTAIHLLPIDGLLRIVTAYGYSIDGIAYADGAKNRVHHVMVILGPRDSHNELLDAVGRMTREFCPEVPPTNQ